MGDSLKAFYKYSLDVYLPKLIHSHLIQRRLKSHMEVRADFKIMPSEMAVAISGRGWIILLQKGTTKNQCIYLWSYHSSQKLRKAIEATSISSRLPNPAAACRPERWTLNVLWVLSHLICRISSSCHPEWWKCWTFMSSISSRLPNPAAAADGREAEAASKRSS